MQVYINYYEEKKHLIGINDHIAFISRYNEYINEDIKVINENIVQLYNNCRTVEDERSLLVDFLIELKAAIKTRQTRTSNTH